MPVCQRPLKHGRVGIAAGRHDDQVAIAIRMEKRGRECRGTARFERDLQAGECCCHGEERFVVGDHEAGAAMRLQDRKGQLAGRYQATALLVYLG